MTMRAQGCLRHGEECCFLAHQALGRHCWQRRWLPSAEPHSSISPHPLSSQSGVANQRSSYEPCLTWHAIMLHQLSSLMKLMHCVQHVEERWEYPGRCLTEHPTKLNFETACDARCACPSHLWISIEPPSKWPLGSHSLTKRARCGASAGRA